ncbi:hypothetical protein BS47DRAFT_1342737 [Hydnum rufescens UP504]|uniref:DUF7918 domain-containing protein n=1 Tax=Hydnum rufescens UP504 TaxID=1448309 RepID=A0A9P6AZ90_9AGAM|nr:hypothetical protein BS47DRAFT_1342737 [Hydnum rufescens UP504]
MVRVPPCNASVTIQCNGEDLPEYSYELRDQSATCYIPSEEGKHFQLCIARTPSKTSLCVKVYFDGGEDCAIHVVFPRCKEDSKEIYDSLRVNRSTERRLVFAKLKLTDDEDALSATSCIDYNALGTIRVEMTHVVEVRLPSSDSRGVWSWNQDVVHSGTVHERAKKSGGHIVSLGEEIKVPVSRSRSSRECHYLLPPHEVTFRYAPYDVLRARGIIPTPPVPLGNASPASLDGCAVSNAPPPANVKREREDGDDLSDRLGFSDEEEARMYARLKAKKMAKRSNLAKTKFEENGIPAGIFKCGEVIDLTEDD